MAFRHELYDGQGNLVEVTYTKTLEEAKAEKLAEIKAACGEAITRFAPAFKQINAALGVYDDSQAAEITQWIQDCRLQCDQLEADLEAINSYDQLDFIVWPQEES